ncbi:MAG: hypothetical protein IPN94_22690 [Sphingobacteriales bacterium]|nr:hypothetical protein [Sphingobacteriales bacterium]
MLCNADAGGTITYSGCTYFCSTGTSVATAKSANNTGITVTAVSDWAINYCNWADYTFVYLVVNASGSVVQIIDADADDDGVPDFAESPVVNTLIDFDVNGLPPGDYTIQGFHYRITPALNAFSPVPAIGTTLSAIQTAISGGSCGALATGTITAIVLDPIIVTLNTSCTSSCGVPATADQYYVTISVTGGLPSELGSGSYTIGGVPGITSYTYGSGTQYSSAASFSGTCAITATASDNNNPDGGSTDCTDCAGTATVTHLSCTGPTSIKVVPPGCYTAADATAQNALAAADPTGATPFATWKGAIDYVNANPSVTTINFSPGY